MSGVNEYDTGFCPLQDGYGWTNSLTWPSESTQIDENRRFRPGHPAVDIDTAVGEPVYAAETGVVIWAGYSLWGYGNLVVLAHGDGWQTYYGHLSAVTVACGHEVLQGEAIGLSGQTGETSGSYLRFEVHHGGYAYDPLEWLP